MPVDKSLPPAGGPFGDPDLDIRPIEVDAFVDSAPDDMGRAVELEDGSVEVSLNDEPDEAEAVDIPFDANLAEHLSEHCLNLLADDILAMVDQDVNDRKDWESAYEKGVALLGFKVEEKTKPFTGSCGVTHPLLAEAVVRFQAQAITEIFPAGGPVRTKIVGRSDVDVVKQANRVESYMNYLLTEGIPDYREDQDRLLFGLGLAGSAFKKIYWNSEQQRPEAVYIPADDMLIPYGATSLATSHRITHRMRKDRQWVESMQRIGFYRDIDLSTGVASVESNAQAARDEISGVTQSSGVDDILVLYEAHILTALEEKLEKDYKDNGESDEPDKPYVITIEKASGNVLSVRRNWDENDPTFQRKSHFVDYQYVPGVGFYGNGLIHLIGGITSGVTSMLRQIVDAGTFSNFPGGYKSKSLRVTNDKTPIAPGEFRDVDLGLASKIGDMVMPLPYKEPSATLVALLGEMVEEGRRFASLTDMSISNVNQEAPVGTTLALIERSMKVMTAIQARLHNSMKREFKIIADLIALYGPEEYPYELEDDDAGATPLKDFGGRVDVIPVSDPNSSTQAQRIMQAQAALQLAAGSPPGEFNTKKLKRYALEVMGVPNAREILPLDEDIKPTDPISENMMILSMNPVKAFQHQDHEAHMQVHMMAAQDPVAIKTLEQNPAGPAIMAAMMAHVTEHLAMKYRNEMERNIGVQLPPAGQELPPEVEAELSSMAASAADKLFREHRRQEEARIIEEQQNDPVLQLQLMEQELKKLKIVADAERDDKKLELDMVKTMQKGEVDERRLTQEYELGSAKIKAQVLGEILFAAGQTEGMESNERQKIVDLVMKLIDTEQKQAREAAKKES